MTGADTPQPAPPNPETITSTSSPAKNTQDTELIQRSVADLSRKVAIATTNSVLDEKLPKYTEILGVFVALFTFVSIQIQIFSKITNLAYAVLFMFLIFICMIGFLFALHLIINMEKNSFKGSVFSLFALVCIIFFGFGLIAYLTKTVAPFSFQQDMSTGQNNEFKYVKSQN